MNKIDPAWKGKYAWSVSSDSAWHSCKHMFYLRYVAPWQPYVNASTRSKLYAMKRLTSLSMLEGKIVHEVIEEMIQQHRLGRFIGSQTATNRFELELDRFKKSASDTIAEGFNGLIVEDTFFDLVKKDGKSQIDNFVKLVWPQLVDLEYLTHEEFENFVLNGIKVNVKVDYVSRSPNGKIVLTDWKTGAERSLEEGTLQMSVYGMWASSKYGVPLSNVMVELAHLRTGKSHPIKLDEAMIGAAKECIFAGASEILSTETTEDFGSNPKPQRCVACPFARLCPEGTQLLTECLEPVEP